MPPSAWSAMPPTPRRFGHDGLDLVAVEAVDPAAEDVAEQDAATRIDGRSFDEAVAGREHFELHKVGGYARRARCRLLDAIVQGRTARRGVGRTARRRTRAASADHAASQRTGSGRVVGRAAASRPSAAGARDVDAVSVAGQQHGMVVLDDAGAVVRPAKLWNDTESAPDAAWLVKQLGGPEAWVAACGSVPLAAFTIAKLSWLHRSEPEAWARLARVCLPHDWLTLRLSGEFVTDRGDASGTGYFNAAEERVPPGSPRRRRRRTRLGDAGCPASSGRVPAPASRRAFGKEAIVAAGTGDNMAAALGVGLGAGRRRRVDRDVGNGLRGERRADRRRNRRGRVVRGRDRPLPSVGVHAERDEGHRRGGAAARRRRGRTRRARARGARGRCRRRRPRARRRPVLRRRARPRTGPTRPVRSPGCAPT